MAGNEIDKSKKTRESLRALECPYIEGLDEHMTHALLLSNGEARLRLIEWLVEKYQPQILLRQSSASLISSTSPRLTKLSLILSDMCLCLPHETDLIQGTCAERKSLRFMDSLVELVHISCQMRSPNFDTSLSFESSTVATSTTKASEEMNRRCYFIDSLCRHGNSGLTNPAPISLIPATIGHMIKIDGSKKGTLPPLSELRSKLDNLREELLEKELQLKETEKEHVYAPIDKGNLTACLQSLQVSFSTLNQLIDDFSYQYQSDINQWTDSKIKKINAFSDFGSSAKRLHSHLSTIKQLLEGISRLESVTGTLMELGERGPENSKSKSLSDKAHEIFQKQIERDESEHILTDK